MSEEKLIRLNLALDYPVDWNFEKVLRDLVQNFYDSIGYRNFEKDFGYDFFSDKNNQIHLTLSAQGYPFDYECSADFMPPFI